MFKKRILANNILHFFLKITYFLNQTDYFKYLLTNYLLVEIAKELKCSKKAIHNLIIINFLKSIFTNQLPEDYSSDLEKLKKILLKTNKDSVCKNQDKILEISQIFADSIGSVALSFSKTPEETAIQEAFRLRSNLNFSVLDNFDSEIKNAVKKIVDKESFWLDLFYLENVIPDLFQTYVKGKFRYSVLETVAALANQLLHVHGYLTLDHVYSVAETSEQLARLLKFSKKDIFLIKIAGLLHDIGKVTVPREILNHPGKLNSAQLTMIRIHSYFTYVFLRVLDPPEIVLSAAFHHEKLDGTGYPFHLEEADIPLSSQIISVADIYRALHEDRPYRNKFSESEIKSIMQELVGNKSLNPEIAALLCY